MIELENIRAFVAKDQALVCKKGLKSTWEVEFLKIYSNDALLL